MLCPNVENFCPNNGQFFSVGDATASPASPCRTLMGTGYTNTAMWKFESSQEDESRAQSADSLKACTVNPELSIVNLWSWNI